MKPNLNLISKKTALSSALLGVLMAVSPAYATITPYSSSYFSYDTNSQTGTFTVDSELTIDTNTPLLTVSGDYSSSDFTLYLTGSNILTLYNNNSSKNIFLGGITASTETTTIKSLTMYVSGGELDSTYTNIGADASTAWEIDKGAVVGVRLLTGWSSFEATNNVESYLSNLVLYTTGTLAWTAVEIDNQSGTDTVTAKFDKNVLLSLSHVTTKPSTDTAGIHTQIFGLSIGNNESSDSKTGSRTSTVTVGGNIGLNISYSDLADAKNVRGASNEGGSLTVGAGITVYIAESYLPGTTLSGLFTDTKSTIYKNTGIASTTSVTGNVVVELVDVSQAENESTTVFGVNLSTNNGSNQGVTGDITIKGNVLVTLNNSGLDTTSDAYPISGYFGGYFSSPNNTSDVFSSYNQSATTKTITGYIYVDIENAYHNTGTSDGVYGIYKTGSEKLVVGDGTYGVEVISKAASEGVLLGVYSAAGATTISGSIIVGANGATDSYAVGAAVTGGSFSSGDIIVGALNLDMNTNVAAGTVSGLVVDGAGLGNVSAGAVTVGIGASSTMTYGMDENIYGVVVTTGTTFSDDYALSQTGNINVMLAGDNANLKLTGAVYGFVAGNGATNYSYGSTALTFGYTTSSGTSMAFTSSEDAPLKGTFANFDSVRVSDGSSLYISSASQASNLAVDTAVFGKDYAAGIDASDSRIFGMYSYGGVVALPESKNTLTFYDSSTTTSSFIEKLENTAGTVTIGSNVTLTVSQGENASGSGGISGTGSIVFTSAPTDSKIETYDGFTNAGTISVSNVTVSGADVDVESTGSITATKNISVSGGSLTSYGPLVAEANFTISDGAVTSTKSIEAYRNFTISGGTLTSSGSVVVGGDFTISGGEVTSSDSIEADNDFTISDGTLTSTGSVVVGGDFTISGGTVAIDKGTFTNGGSAYLEGGTFTVGSTDDSAVQVQLNPVSSSSGVHVNTAIKVYANSTLGLGTSSVMEDATRALSLVGLTDQAATSSVVAIDTAMVSGDYGYIGAGNGTNLPNSVSTVATVSSYAISTVADTSSGDDYGLHFGDESILVVNVNGKSVTADDGSHTSSAFTTTSDSSSVAIDDGATIVLYGDLTPGRYNITKGYSVDPETISGWDENKDQIIVYVEDAAGLYWTYTREALLEADGNDTDYVVINVIDHQPVQEVYPTNIPNIVNDSFDDCNANPGASYICQVLRDTDLTTDEKIQIVNSSSLMPFLGGVMSVAMSDMGYGFGELYNHLTMDSDTFGATGNLWPYQENNNFWIDVIGHWTLSRKLDGTGLKGAKYHDSTFGFIIGYDRKIENRPFAVGAAFSFLDGNLKSGGNGTRTKNEHQSYGLHIWGNYSPNEHLNLIGSLHWLHNNAGLTQYINRSYALQASGHVATDMFAIGLRAETTIRIGNAVSVIPHVEPRYIYGKSHAFDTKVDGNQIWRTKFGGNSLFQIPVGVAVRADYKTESGWTVRPNLDVSVIPQVGATSQKMTVTNVNNVSDVIYGQYQGKFAAEGKIGVSLDKGAWTFGAKYGLGGGTKGRIEQGFVLEGRLRF